MLLRDSFSVGIAQSYAASAPSSAYSVNDAIDSRACQTAEKNVIATAGAAAGLSQFSLNSSRDRHYS